MSEIDSSDWICIVSWYKVLYSFIHVYRKITVKLEVKHRILGFHGKDASFIQVQKRF